MNPSTGTLWGLVSAAILALAGWVYSTGQRVAVVETQSSSIQQQLNEIHTDVRELRNKLLGEKP